MISSAWLGLMSPWTGIKLDSVALAATLRSTRRCALNLVNPTHIRLSPELITWLDSWRGDRMSRGAAIRFHLHQAMELHQYGFLPPTELTLNK
jgi:hypothetical protein